MTHDDSPKALPEGGEPPTPRRKSVDYATEPRPEARRRDLTEPPIERLLYSLARTDPQSTGLASTDQPRELPSRKRRGVLAAAVAAAAVAVGLGLWVGRPGAPIGEGLPSSLPAAPPPISAAPPAPSVPVPPPVPPSPLPRSGPTLHSGDRAPVAEPRTAERRPTVEEEPPAPAPPVAAPSTPEARPVPDVSEAPAAPVPAVSESAPVVEVARREVNRVARAYVESFESLDVAATASLWPGIDTRELGRAFQSVRRQDVLIDKCDISSDGGQASATCTGEITYVPKVGSPKPRSRRVRWDFQFVERGNNWLIENVKASTLQ